MQRARKAEDKQERRQAILAAGWQMFRTMPYAGITMNAIADTAGLAKGTLYLYFTTKEALFATLYGEQLESWLNDIDACLDSTRSSAEFARYICTSLRQRHDFLRLAVILHPILEQNITREQILSLKQLIIQRLIKTGVLLEIRLRLAGGEGARFFLHLNALIVGLYQEAYPAPQVQAVLEANQITFFNIDLFHELEDMLVRLLNSAPRA